MTLYHSRDKEGFKDLNHMKAVFSRIREKDLVIDYNQQDQVEIGPVLENPRYFKITLSDRGTGIDYHDEVKFVFGEDLESQKRAAIKKMSGEIKPHSGDLEARFEEILKDQRQQSDFTKKPSAVQSQYYKITMRDLGAGIDYHDEVKFVHGKDLADQKRAAEKRMSEETKPHSDNLEFKFEKMSTEEQLKLEQSQNRGISR
jgi:phage tail tube protein FII